MTICAYLEATGKSVADLARDADVPVSTLYRWHKEERETGRVRAIDGDGLAALSKGSDGKIVADDVLGTKPKKKRSAA